MTPTKWDFLTPTEYAVAKLVGDGLTNGQIAIRRKVERVTIEKTLTKIYSKLHIDGEGKKFQLAQLYNKEHYV